MANDPAPKASELHRLFTTATLYPVGDLAHEMAAQLNECVPLHQALKDNAETFGQVAVAMAYAFRAGRLDAIYNALKLTEPRPAVDEPAASTTLAGTTRL